jgi:signal transduction histidine kinase
MDLESHRFISYFEPEQAAQLCQLAVIEHFPQGAIVFEENQVPDSLYLVLSGKVEFSKQTTSKHYQPIAWAKPNDFFGEFGVLDGKPRSARAVACESSCLAKIPRDRLMEILERTPGRVVLKIFDRIIHYLRSTTDLYINQVIHKQKMALVGEMVNTIVHDFKSPFTGIHLASSMLKELHPDDDTQEWCDLIQAQVTRMMAMAEEVLEFTRGSATLHKKKIDISAILTRFEKLNRIYFKEAKVNFEIVTEENLCIEADESKLMRVLQNLTGNAVDAMEDRGGYIKIMTRADKNWIYLTIADNGPGIPDLIRERLFEPFVTYGKRSGTGLGTAIAKSIIDAHGGEISFISELEKGTTFSIRFPLHSELDSEMNRELETPLNSASEY